MCGLHSSRRVHSWEQWRLLRWCLLLLRKCSVLANRRLSLGWETYVRSFPRLCPLLNVYFRPLQESRSLWWSNVLATSRTTFGVPTAEKPWVTRVIWRPISNGVTAQCVADLEMEKEVAEHSRHFEMGLDKYDLRTFLFHFVHLFLYLKIACCFCML